MPFVTTPPGKYVWAIGAVLINLAKLPLLPLYYLPKSLRPHPEWTIFQSITNHVMNSFLFHTAYVEVVTPLDLQHKDLGDSFISIPTGPDSLYTGVVKSDSAIIPLPTGGIWYPNAPETLPSEDDRPLILHFHPGGYVVGDVISDGAFAARLLTERIGSHALMNIYRLASNPNGRFPAALQDALSTYHFLVKDMSIPASRIVLSGDSAGGHIVISMLRYISEHGNETGLPAPKAAMLFSPAIDMIANTNPDNTSKNRNFANDFLDPLFISWGAKCFVSDKPGASPYMNPRSAPFRSPCPLWVFWGGNEVFCDEIAEFVNQMESVPGNDITRKIDRLANHDIFSAGRLTGWKAEAESIADEAGRWLKQLNAT